MLVRTDCKHLKHLVVFFFKQKTEYKMATGLEVKGVLFRVFVLVVLSRRSFFLLPFSLFGFNFFFFVLVFISEDRRVGTISGFCGFAFV